MSSCCNLDLVTFVTNLRGKREWGFLIHDNDQQAPPMLSKWSKKQVSFAPHSNPMMWLVLTSFENKEIALENLRLVTYLKYHSFLKDKELESRSSSFHQIPLPILWSFLSTFFCGFWFSLIFMWDWMIRHFLCTLWDNIPWRFTQYDLKIWNYLVTP